MQFNYAFALLTAQAQAPIFFRLPWVLIRLSMAANRFLSRSAQSK